MQSKSARIVPFGHKDYISVAEELTAYEDAMLAEQRRQIYALTLKELTACCPDPIPNWAAAFMCHLLIESLRG